MQHFHPILPLLQGSDVGSEGCHTDGETDSPTASPTIPALRTTPFHCGTTPPPPLLPQPVGKASLPALPQLALGLLGRGPPLQQQENGAGSGLPIPRLDLSQSAHSNLEMRNASAEMQLAADAEQARARQGRGVLGELERSALGKGKVQAATGMRKLNSALSGARGFGHGRCTTPAAGSRPNRGLSGLPACNFSPPLCSLRWWCIFHHTCL